MAGIRLTVVARMWLFAGLYALCGLSLANQTVAENGRRSTAAENGPSAVVPGAAAEPLAWLDRIAEASQRVNYVGTFSYQAGGHAETSRIVHRYARGKKNERLEVLDGSPREVIRQNEQVRCVLPEKRTVIIGQSGARSGFPGRLPQSHVGLTGNYRVRLKEIERVAGHEAQKLVLEPRDELRFGHALWAELQSGLLLKSQVLDAKGEVIEQFTFSDVRIGGEIDDGLLVPRVKVDADWHTVDVGGDDEAQSANRWGLKEPLPGFTLTTVMRHRNGGALQMVFSDGLAAISIFIESADAKDEARGAYSGGGAVNVFERVTDGYRITALGEVPALLVQRAAEAIEAL